MMSDNLRPKGPPDVVCKSRTSRQMMVAALAIGLAFGGIVLLGRQYQADPAFFLSRVAYDWHNPRFAAFHRLYSRIQVGMNRQELQQTINRVYPAQGRRKPPRFHADEPTQIILFMENSSCEGIILTLTNDQVSAKHYSPD